MAGHNRFKKIKHKKEAEDMKKSKLNPKLLRAVTVAAQSGIPDPKMNSKLKIAMMAAKAANIPKSSIENAIKKTSEKDESKLQEGLYEGFGPSNVNLIVETISDNVSRTFAALRKFFNKNKGNLATPGCVAHMFKHLGLITYPEEVKKKEEVEDLAIEAGADDCVLVDGEYEIYCKFGDFHSARDELEKTLGEAKEAKLFWKPDSTLILEHEKTKQVLDFIEGLEELEDVQTVYSNLEIPDDYDPEKMLSF